MSSGRKLAKLEALRGFAAFYVMLGHTFSNKLIIAGKNFSFLLDFGQEAVMLFFILSGFVIQYSFERSTDKSFGLYFIKRFLRIYIPIILVFITHYLLLSYYEGAFIGIDGVNLAGNLLMLQDSSSLKPNVVCSYFLGNSPLWSLSYEWWFYMIFFFVYTKKREQASVIVYIMGIIAAATYILYPNFINRILMYLTIWWIGADIARLYLNKQRINFSNLKWPLIFIVIQTGLLGVNILVNREKLAQELHMSSIGISPFLEFRHFVSALIALTGALIWHKLHWRGFDATIGKFEIIAPISFGIYISHWFLVAKAHYFDHLITNDVLRWCAYFATCFLFSYIVERVIYPFVSNKIMLVYKRRSLGRIPAV